MRLTKIATILLFAPTIAFAQAAPKGIDFSAPILGLDGKPMKDGDADLTLGRAAADALCGQAKDDSRTPVQHAEDCELGLRLVNAKTVSDLSIDQLHEIRDMIGRGFVGGIVQARAWPMIDAATK